MRPRAMVTAAAVTLAACATGNGAAPPPGRPAARLSAVPRVARLPAAASRRHLVPQAGAYLGAYVQPARFTPQAEIGAVLAFEHRLGRPIGLVHVYHPWVSPFPNAADRYFARHGKVLLLTWGGTPDTRAIIAGRDDSLIRARARALRRLGRPVLLEWRHEMDRPNLRWAVHSPADYRAAWRHIRGVFSAAGAGNVSWVWCPTAAGFASGRAQAYYPGDGEVDWLCADAYATSPAQPLRDVLMPFLVWASHHPKPIVLGEFGVRNDPAGWASWLAGVGALAERDAQIKALAYFDANGTSSTGQPYFFSLSHNAAAVSELAALLAKPYFHPRVPATGGS